MTETLSPELPDDIERLVHAVLSETSQRGISLATAESCTGGLLASLLTDVEGASHTFERGFVVYSEASKCDVLGVARDQITRCGAVSREGAMAMAEGAPRDSGAQLVVAITGFAGPAPEGEEPGLVHFACAHRGIGIAHREKHFGNVGRGAVRLASQRVALDMMRSAINSLAAKPASSHR
jgi:nicotinamide-nucleotide amidase